MLHFAFVKPDSLLAINYASSVVWFFFFLAIFLFIYLMYLHNLFDGLLVYPNKFEKGHGRNYRLCRHDTGCHACRTKYIAGSALIL